MRTNKYQLDDFERDQEDATRRRRRKRSQRYYRMLFAVLAVLLVFLLAAPSLISATGITQGLVRDAVAEYGWKSEIGKVRLGWLTPLSAEGIQLVGSTGETRLDIERLDSSLTLPQLLRFDASQLGEITLRGVNLEAAVSDGDSSLEADLKAFFESPGDEETRFSTEISVQDATATLKDKGSGQTWVLDQSNLECVIAGGEIQGQLAGVMTEPDGGGGAIEGQFQWKSSSETAPVDVTESKEAGWKLSLQTDSFPLSTLNLVSRRYGEQLSGFPEEFSGDATGLVRVIGTQAGSFQAAIENLRVRNLVTVGGVAAGWNESREGSWANSMATLDGELSLNDGWLFGYGLTATTDFGGATIDGAFPTHVTLTGQGDNPVQWLQAFDGKAHMEIDLAALDKALPGLIPLRADAALVSGRAIGTIENQRGERGGGKSRLKIASESLRARSGGRAVIIEPVELAATVSAEGGELRAEAFELTSTFARASGQGSIRSGSADVQVDFGRLYTMLRPIIDLSDLSLGGTAGGRVQWEVTPIAGGGGDRWSLRGNGEGQNLLVTLPDGNRFKRSVVRAELSAVGHWDGNTLDELSVGQAVIHSGGVYAKAELMRPVSQPSAKSSYSIRLSGDGRMENLAESLRPWLPMVMRDAEGRITWTAETEIGNERLVLSKAHIDLNQPRIAIGEQWYGQPQVKVDFKGTFDLPSGNLYSDEFTLVGEAISLAVRGNASRENTHLDVAWQADLERMQASLGTRFAAAQATMRSASYRPTDEADYRVTGRCKGKGTLTDAGDQWQFVTEASAGDLRLLQSVARLAPPGTPSGLIDQEKPTFGQSFANPTRPREVWHEPELVVKGPILISKNGERMQLKGLQIANDWFAGTLSGVVSSADEQIRVDMTGPTRWKMDEIARRLTQLSGSTIVAEGIHESQLKFRMRSGGNQPTILEATGDIGWTSCELGGVWIGRASMPFKMTEDHLVIDSSSFPVAPVVGGSGGVSGNVSDLGIATVSAEVTYADGDRPMLVRLGQGSRIESLSITREMAAGWLQYLAPLAAGATSVDGKLGAELDEAVIVIDDLASSRVRGRLRVDQMTLATGPMAQQLVLGVRQLKSLARAAAGGEPIHDAQTVLMTMPPQLVDFEFDRGVVTHQRMLFQVDQAQLMTSGTVDLQTQLDLMAQIPLDASWLGSDLSRLAGQSVTFPIRGTLSRPALDSSAIREIVTRLGTQAGAEVIQNRLEGIMQKQLGSGLEQINSGLEKLLGF